MSLAVFEVLSEGGVGCSVAAVAKAMFWGKASGYPATAVKARNVAAAIAAAAFSNTPERIKLASASS
jgi:hypothetical protein